MAVDTLLKRRAVISTAHIWSFQGSEGGGTITDMADRVVMGFCYPFEHMAPPALGIIGIKWLGNKTWLADRKAREQKARGQMSKQQMAYRTDDEVEATAKVRMVRWRDTISGILAWIRSGGR